MTQEAAKLNSHAFLRAHKIKINEHLPLIEAEEDLSPQDATAVATRSMILCHVIGIGFGGKATELGSALKEYNLFEFASTKERDLLSRDTHTHQERIDATWLVESMQSLAWCMALTKLDPLGPCDEDLAGNFPDPFTDPRSFISEASLRPFDEIYAQADLHYRLHWAARDARLRGESTVLNEGLISERRKALEWVIGTCADWDEIPLDT